MDCDLTTNGTESDLRFPSEDSSDTGSRTTAGMSSKSRLPEGTAEELPRELIELGTRISRLPAASQRELELIYNEVVESVRRRRRILALVQEALAQLRLDIKYLMFDLEVTREERDALRERLDGN